VTESGPPNVGGTCPGALAGAARPQDCADLTRPGCLCLRTQSSPPSPSTSPSQFFDAESRSKNIASAGSMMATHASCAERAAGETAPLMALACRIQGRDGLLEGTGPTLLLDLEAGRELASKGRIRLEGTRRGVRSWEPQGPAVLHR